MTQPAPPRLQLTSVRTRVVNGHALVGFKHTAKDASGERVVLLWIAMPPEDARTLAKKLPEAQADTAQQGAT